MSVYETTITNQDNNMNYNNLDTNAIYNLFPFASIEEDNSEQVVIYTGLMGDDGDLLTYNESKAEEVFQLFPDGEICEDDDSQIILYTGIFNPTSEMGLEMAQIA